MPGKPLCSDAEAELQGFRGPAAQRRRDVLRETLRAFETHTPPDYYHRLAEANLARWSAAVEKQSSALLIDVVEGDWGEVARVFTQTHGVCFAVLNMANAYSPGGAYAEGAIAQEENMFRRTDCHFSLQPEQLDAGCEKYSEEMTQLISGRDLQVYLDVSRPRVCIRGAENRELPDLGYPWLTDTEVFPFYELRAAAQDLRSGGQFDLEDARRRIAAQLDTLRWYGIRYAILGASGCGAFGNPADQIARLYRKEIAKRANDFSVLAFAIFAAGYGPDNFTPFYEEFQGSRR